MTTNAEGKQPATSTLASEQGAKMKDDLQEIAERRARAQEVVTLLGMMNYQSDPKERLAADVRYRLALDALNKASDDYQRAISSLSTEQMMELSGFNPISYAGGTGGEMK